MTSQEPSTLVFTVTGAFALLTFVLAFYALVARERRTPYITTNTVYWTALLVLGALLLVFLGRLSEQIAGLLSGWAAPLRTALERVAQWTLLIALVHVIWRVFSLKNSHISFRTDKPIKNLRPVRLLRSTWRSLRSKPSFEHAQVQVPTPLLDALQNVEGFPVDRFRSLRGHGLLDVTHGSFGVGYRPRDFRSGTKAVVELAMLALRQECYFQFTTAARHPVEVVRYLQARWTALGQGNWQDVAGRIVVIDAFTSHFGFTDTVHEEAAKEIRLAGVSYVYCPPSYAGIHTANAEAFNVLKDAAAKAGRPQMRQTGLIVYEGTHSLVDLESAEQYRIFVRHVLASERMWRGMITVFVDAAIPDAQWDVVSAYVDAELFAESGKDDGSQNSKDVS